jgi:ADP-heptose:LPS heptosyltransferase
MIILNNRFPRKIQIVYKSKVKDEPYITNGSTVFEPECRCMILGFGFHHWDKDKYPRKLIQKAIENHIGIIYVCDELPKDYILDEHIVYIVTGFEWFTHLLFRDLKIFKGVFHNGNKDSEKYATILRNRGEFCVPLLGSGKNVHLLDNVVDEIERSEKSVLIETFDGLGDVLMSLPSAKTMHEKGYKVSYYTRHGFEPIFENLDFIDKIYYNADIIPTTSFISYISLTHKLSSYNKEYNQQHRIYASAYFFGLTPEELVTQKPIIELTEEEKEFSVKFLSQFKNTVGICWDAHGFSRGYPQDHTQKLCTLLYRRGFNPVVLSLNPHEFQHAVNLGGQLNLRQLFAIVAGLDYMVTVDTGTLHIAGAFDKPTVAIMGPIPAEWRCSTYKDCVSIVPKVKCCPCADGQYVPVSKMECRRKDNWCLRAVKPEQVISELLKLKRKVERGDKNYRDEGVQNSYASR